MRPGVAWLAIDVHRTGPAAANSMVEGLGAISLLMVLGALAAIVLAPRITGLKSVAELADDKLDDSAAASAVLCRAYRPVSWLRRRF